MGKKHWDSMIPIVVDNGVRRMAEVGVFRSSFCKRILKDVVCRRVLDEYWAIDPWIEFSSASDRYYENIDEDMWNELYMDCCELMLYFDQLRVLRIDSVKAASMFPDRYFDLVFIDGNHDYEAVKTDILMWMPKIRNGGIISGHDYLRTREDLLGVTKAVDDLFDSVEEGPSGVWYRRIL